jgi:hypothetical protein
MHKRCLLPFVVALSSAPVQAEDPFALIEIPVANRAIQADLRDVDGDGAADLLWTSLEGQPPRERRQLRAHYQRRDGGFESVPDWQHPMPGGVAAYDLADLDGRPGVELVLMRRNGLEVLSLFGRRLDLRVYPVPGPPTLAATTDERGVDRLRIVRDGLVAGPLLIVPGFGETTVLGADGAVRGVLRAGARANYFLPPRPGPTIAESEMEIYFDHPRIGIADTDGDGRADVIASNRHELRVFRQREDGRFEPEPDQRIPLERLTPEDHARSAGSVRVEPSDFDGDGRADLLVSSSRGSLFAADTEAAVHLNRDGTWNLAQPDQVFRTEGGLTSSQLIDIDGDGRVELMSARIPTGVLEIVEFLLTRAIDAQVSLRRGGSERPFEEKPSETRTLDIGVSFETFRPLGFIPTLEPDLNGDGHLDYIGSGDGDELQIHLGSPENGYRKLHASQDFDTTGRIRFGDLQGDGLADFVIYDPRRPGSSIRIAINRGVLPGSPEPELRLRAADARAAQPAETGESRRAAR